MKNPFSRITSWMNRPLPKIGAQSELGGSNQPSPPATDTLRRIPLINMIGMVGTIVMVAILIVFRHYTVATTNPFRGIATVVTCLFSLLFLILALVVMAAPLKREVNGNGYALGEETGDETDKQKQAPSKPKRRRFLKLSLATVVIVALAIYFLGGWARANISGARVDPTFRPSLTCDDSYKYDWDVRGTVEAEPESPARNSFVAQGIPEGCWGKKIILPETFASGWCFSPDPVSDAANKDWRIHLKFLNPDGSVFAVESFWWGDPPFLKQNYPMEFRLQGHAPAVSFFRGYWNARTGACVPND